MTHDIIKLPIPTEISEAGGARVQLVNKRTVPLDTSIREAIDGHYVSGDENFVKNIFEGMFRSMSDGVQRDGHARQIADFITLYPSVEGAFDLDVGWNPAVNKVRLKCRLLNKLEIDISNWSFRDVTPGRHPFKLTSVSSGDVDGVVVPGQAVHINAKDLPSEITVSWVCGTQHATVAAAKVTHDATRVNLAADALDALKSTTYNGKPIAFTIRGAFANAKIEGLVAYNPPPHATLTNVRTSELDEPNELSIADSVTLTFDKADPQGMQGKLVINGVEQAQPLTPTGTSILALWTWDREELIGQTITIAFKYTDGTVTTLLTKIVRAERT